MVLLEFLRGSASSIPASSIDDIVNDEDNAGIDGLAISISFADEDAAARGEGEAKMATVRRGAAHARTSIHSAALAANSKEKRQERFKKAHEYCRAVIPRRIKDFKRDAQNNCEWHYDENGMQIWRLRQMGDPSSVRIGGQDEDVGTKQYELCCAHKNISQPITAICTNTHWALGDFGIGVGLYYTMLVTWMVLFAALFLLNAAPMYCNQQFKSNLAEYKSCRGLEFGNGTFTHAHDARNLTCAMMWMPSSAVSESTPLFCGFQYPMPSEYTQLNASGEAPVDRQGASNSTTGWVTTWDLWIAQQDYAGAGNQIFPRYDYGGSLAPLTPLQGGIQVASVLLMILFMVSLRRYFKAIGNEFDENLLSAQDFSVRVSGVLPRDPQAYYDHFNELLRQAGNLGGRGALIGVAGEHEHGVVRVTVVYDNDKMFKALRARSLARRAYKAALLAYEVRDPNETPDFQMQRELYLKGSKDGRTPTFSSSLKQMLGCGKSGMYAAHHRLVKAERAVEKAIQELKKQDETVKKGEYKPVYDGPGNTQLDDMDMQNHRRPIFAFVTFQSEDQQSFIKKYYDKGYLINRKRRQDGLECLVNYVQNTSEGEGWLKHPLPANAPADVKAARKQLGADLLDNCVCVEAQEPSDINWETQGYLTTKMPLGDPALDFTNRPGGANKWCHRVFRSFAAYTAAGFILVVLFTILLFVTVWTQQLLDFLGIKDATTITAVGYGIAGIITLINILLPNIMKQFVFRLEINTSETEKQTSLVIKLTLVRICNAVLITFLVTNYNEMLSLSLVSKISSLLVLDITVGPTLRLIGIYNLVMRYCVAKKARTQPAMNAHFNGTYWNLAERYTDVTKTFFLAIFYAAIAPSGYLLAFTAIFVNYFVDKYLLLRRWRIPPKFNSTISDANRYFQYLAILSHACIALYFYRNWPFQCNTIPTTTDVLANEKTLCSANQGRNMLSGGFSRFEVNENQLIWYIPVLVLMIVTIIIIFYYFCFKQCLSCFNSLFKCKKKELEDTHAKGDIEKVDEAFTSQEHPDWYYPRISGTIEAGTPQQMSNLLIRYMIEKDAEAKKEGRAGWKWPGQMSEHMPGDKTHALNGTNLFQSSLMIEHKIFHHNVGMAKIVGAQQPNVGAVNISSAPMMVGGMQMRGVNSMGVGIGFPRV
jgi:hypothetical protein